MTAWYALLLALALAALGIALSVLLRRELHEDIDQRLLRTAVAINNRAKVEAAYETGSINVNLPRIDPIASPGQVVQILDPNSEVRGTTGDINDPALPAVPFASDSRGPAFHTAKVDGVTVRTVRLPMVTERTERLVGAIVVGESLEPINRALGLLRRLLLVTSVGGIGLAVLGGWLLAGRALRPVRNVTATADAIAAGEGSAASLATRLVVPDTGDEVARLAATFNLMLDRLEAAFAARQRFVADASHELRTPLTAIRGNVDVLTRQARAGTFGPVSDDLTAALDDVDRESARMGRLLEDLLLLARTEAPSASALRTAQPVRLDEIARETVRTAGALVTGQVLRVDAPQPITIMGDADRLLQLVLILTENALRHTPAGGEVTVEVDQGLPGQARLRVCDTGEGISPEHLPHIFERFYRADGARARSTGGTGLGLAIAQAIVRAHGGEIGVTSHPGRGTVFTVTLPLAPTMTSSLG